MDPLQSCPLSPVPLHLAGARFLFPPLGGCSPSGCGNHSALRNFHIPMHDKSSPHHHFSPVQEMGSGRSRETRRSEQSDHRAGSHCPEERLGGRKGREGGKDIAEKAEAVLANRWRRLSERAAPFTRQRCLVSL